MKRYRILLFSKKDAKVINIKGNKLCSFDYSNYVGSKPTEYVVLYENKYRRVYVSVDWRFRKPTYRSLFINVNKRRKYVLMVD